MVDGKWIEGLQPRMPIADAARCVLEARLGAVVRRLPHALYEAAEDVEHVHQLRVATRRAAAALRIFADCLPVKSHKKARKYLRTLRRSAGEARDADVFLGIVTARIPRARSPQRPGLDFLLGHGHNRRLAAQEQLVAAAAGDETHGAEVVAATLAELDASGSSAATLSALAHPMLSRMLGEVEQSAQQDLKVAENLHRVRILGKRLRYAMEIFACCFDANFQETIYPAVEEMQDILGDANDSHVAAHSLETLCARLEKVEPKNWKRWQAGIEALLTFHQRRVPQKRRQFERWWHHWQGSHAERSFQNMLDAG